MPYRRFIRAQPVVARLTGELWPGMRCTDSHGEPLLSERTLQVFAAAYAVALAAGVGLPAKPLDLSLCLWRRAVLLSRPPSLDSEGVRRRLTVVPDGAREVSHRDARRYARQQP